MSRDTSKPYLIIVSEASKKGKGTVEKHYLVYGSKKLEVSLTEHALLQNGLLEDGLNIEEASEERSAVAKQKELSGDSAKVILSKLRKKIRATFDDLVLPKAKCLHRLRLLTKTELQLIRKRMANPSDGIYVDIDECGQRHLFVNRKEIVPQKTNAGIGPRELAVFSTLLLGSWCKSEIEVNSQSPLFHKTYSELSGRDKLSSPLLAIHVSNLRRELKLTELDITKACRNGATEEAISYRLIKREEKTREIPKPALQPLPMAA